MNDNIDIHVYFDNITKILKINILSDFEINTVKSKRKTTNKKNRPSKKNKTSKKIKTTNRLLDSTLTLDKLLSSTSKNNKQKKISKSPVFGISPALKERIIKTVYCANYLLFKDLNIENNVERDAIIIIANILMNNILLYKNISVDEIKNIHETIKKYKVIDMSYPNNIPDDIMDDLMDDDDNDEEYEV